MSERAAPPGRLTLVHDLVNTVDLATGADALDTPEGRAPFGIAEDTVDDARELRESLRATLLAHAGHPAHRPGPARPPALPPPTRAPATNPSCI
ncbi:hypothetical protein ACPW7O_09035, partial [Streptomyces tunisiensis]